MPRRQDEETSTPLAWRSLPLRLAIVAVPLWFTVSVLIFNVGWPTKLLVAIVLGVSLAAPARGLLLTAGLAPLGHLIAPFVGPGNFRISEAIVLAFLTGWVLRALPDRRGPRVPLPAVGWVFAAAIAASVAGLAWQLRAFPGMLPLAVDQLAHAYYLVVGDAIGFGDAAHLLEGMALVAATVALFRRQPRMSDTLPAVLCGSAAVAALSSVLLWRGIGPAAALERYGRIGYRVSGHVADVNASGSYFAMVLCLALGMAIRARGAARAAWLAMAAFVGVGLWFSESRSALAAAAAMAAIAAVWSATGRWSMRARAAALALIVVTAIGAGAFRARLLEHDPTYRGAGFRTQFNETSARMIEARPLFGVGVGQYYRMSALFFPPQLAFTYGLENAHNNFLQIGAELGLVGLGLFVLWIGAAAAQAARALMRQPRDARLLGAAAGALVFIATGLSGHPLLVPEVAFPFWIQLGLVTALAGSTLLNAEAAGRSPSAAITAPRPASRLAIAASTLILVAVPVIAGRSAVNPPAAQAVDGFYGWETLADGTRYRWTGAYASLFVPADVTRVEVPVRMPSDGRATGTNGVEAMAGGADRGRTLVGSGWTILSIALPEVGPPARFKRVDLKVDRTWQPALYLAGSHDMRTVGVQVGEPRLFRE